MPNIEMIQRGQRIHCILHGGKNGTVVEIHGEQKPGSVQVHGGGVMVTGGNACMDVIWDDGSKSLRVPEAIIRGVQWKILPTVAPESVIQASVEAAVKFEADAKLAAQEKARAHAQQKAQFIAENPHLTSVAAGESSQKTAAANIRKDLKKHWPETKFSVRSSGSSIEIGWTDGPTASAVKPIIERYEDGHFDGMSDIYRYRENAWTAAFGGAHYVFARRELSDDLLCRAADVVFDVLSGNLKDVAKPSIATLKGFGPCGNIPGLNLSIREAVDNVAAAMNGDGTAGVKESGFGKASFVVDAWLDQLASSEREPDRGMKRRM